MGALLTTASTLQCPHDGQVKIVSSNTRARAGGELLVRDSDTFLITGCKFPKEGGPPHPCMSVQWTTKASRAKASGGALLTLDSEGLCLAMDSTPQGPVSILATQTRASAT